MYPVLKNLLQSCGLALLGAAFGLSIGNTVTLLSIDTKLAALADELESVKNDRTHREKVNAVINDSLRGLVQEHEQKIDTLQHNVAVLRAQVSLLVK